jgi:hypothetical protein
MQQDKASFAIAAPLWVQNPKLNGMGKPVNGLLIESL